MKRLALIIPIAFLVASCISGTPGTGQKQTTDPKSQNNSATEATASGTSENEAITVDITSNPVVNVYLETSGSMNGYMDSGKSQFQQVVYEYVSNIKKSKIASEINLFYITDKVTDKGTDIRSFINSLTPGGVLGAAGNHSTTDLADLLSSVLSNTDNNTVSVLISDCLFSPGNVANPSAYLDDQKTSIGNSISEYIDANTLLGCCVYQLNAKFKGRYYDYKNRARNIDQDRPFYIWVFGNPVHLLNLRKRIPEKIFMVSPVKNYWAICNGEVFQPKFGLLQSNPKNGTYRWSASNTIADLKKNQDGQFMFTFGANMEWLSTFFGESYVEDLGNYRNLIDKETLEEFKAMIAKDTVKSSPYTYDFHVISDKMPAKGKLHIVFDGSVPQWVYDCSDMDDSDFGHGNDLATYGFKYMCDGIYAGFHTNGTNNIVAEFSFEIK